MRELVNIGSAVFDRPELRGDRDAVRARNAQPDATGCAFGRCESFENIGPLFFRFPAFRIDRLVGGPGRFVEMCEDIDVDLLRLAFERGAHLARASGPIFGKCSASYGQDVIFIALITQHKPTRIPESLLQLFRRAVLIGKRGECDSMRSRPQIAC